MRKPGEIFTGFLFLWGQMLQNLSMGQIAPGYEKQNTRDLQLTIKNAIPCIILFSASGHQLIIRLTLLHENKRYQVAAR